MTTVTLRRIRQRGQEAFEFGLVLLPLLTFVGLILDVSWAVWVKGTLQNAVRQGCRLGVTNRIPDGESATDLTTAVKNRVKYYAMGLLDAEDQAALIKVHYYQPPLENCVGAQCILVNMDASPDGNRGENIMVVAVEGYRFSMLLPLFMEETAYGEVPIAASSADRIEPTRNPPPKGAAP